MDDNKKIFVRNVLFVLLIFVLGIKSYASEFIVSTASEISQAMGNAQPGDTLTMTNGYWTNQQIKFVGNGALNDSILLRADSSGRVILNGTSTLRIAGSYLKVDGLFFNGGQSTSGAVIEFRNGSSNLASHCRLTNTAIQNYNPASSSTDYKWISMYGDSNRVDHCYMKGKNHSGTTLVVWLTGYPNYHRIDHNYFAERPELGVNGGETIRVGTSDWSMFDSYTLVEHNYFEHCNGETEIISNKSCNNTFRYNTFFESEGTLTLRHGNWAKVYGNFFIGNHLNDTGGVRVIGEDHLIYNNYFQDLAGSSFRAALPIMNGVPNSPLNRYFQVKRAKILFNTFVNCNKTIILGAGADNERTLPPEDCLIANNTVKTYTSIISEEDQPINLVWEGNIMHGSSLGITQPAGINFTDPMLILASDSLWRPDTQSPVIGAAAGTYANIITDMDGQSRLDPKDVGADQVSPDPVILRPLKAEDVWPNWFPIPPEPPIPQNITYVGAGLDSLKLAVENAVDDEIIELTTDAGIYENNANIVVTSNIIIRSADSLFNRPIIRQTNPSTSTRVIFEIQDGGSLTLIGLELDGMANSATPAKYLIRTDDDPMTENYGLKIDDCYLHDVVLGSEGNFFRAYEGTFADSIIITNSLFYNSGKEGIRLKDEATNSGLYNVRLIEIRNSTFWQTNKEAIDIYAGDNIPFTPGPEIRLDHCTFDSCGYNNAGIINFEEADNTEIKNSIFSNSPTNSYSIGLYGLTAIISHSDTFNVGQIDIQRSANIGQGMMDADPLYLDRTNGDFTLLQTSPVWWQGDDGEALGDLNWATNPPTSIDESDGEIKPDKFVLYQNYPNPFNPSTNISYNIPKTATVNLSVYDITGSLVEYLISGKQNSGLYTIQWQPTNLSSGVYLLRLDINGQSFNKKMMYLR